MPVIIVVNSDISAASGEKAHAILCQTICDSDILVNDIPTKNEVGYDALSYDYYVKNIMPLVSAEK